ncbi:hypothetical protein FIBSPDRAFT_898057 [Athelia psychrophila]|uniref:Uncharacterized protein n=1 Tax=Athelia psychrophila TaxID=1759441 RepID=A0A166BDW2_9AGAM|nr:hypothetical protein FIBSPDRAFT_898057 [Fibularhizoctonia sp. CBS 109695]
MGVFVATSSTIPDENWTGLDFLTWHSLLDEKKETFNKCAAKSANELFELLCADWDMVTNVIDILAIPAIKKFSSHFKSGPQLLLAIDKCHPLTVPQPSPGCDPYHCYWHPPQMVDDSIINIVGGSITLNVGEQKSGRVSDPGALYNLKQHAPYILFPFDLYNAGLIITEEKKTLSEMSDIRFLCCFGCSLWYTCWNKVVPVPC